MPFRLTQNLVEFISSIGLRGPLQASAIATARCLVQPNFKLSTILRAILRDEIMSVHKRRIIDEVPMLDANGELPEDNSSNVNMTVVVSNVNNSVNSIMQRLNSIAYFDNDEQKITTLVQIATNPDNLCRMDPAWHPWI